MKRSAHRRPAEVAISNTSGLAGISYWINKHYSKKMGKTVTKHDDVVIKMKSAIDKEYADGRTTLMGDDELHGILVSIAPDFVK